MSSGPCSRRSVAWLGQVAVYLLSLLTADPCLSLGNRAVDSVLLSFSRSFFASLEPEGECFFLVENAGVVWGKGRVGCFWHTLHGISLDVTNNVTAL